MAMNNNEKLEFLLKLERREKRKQWLLIILGVTVLGSAALFAFLHQYRL